MMTSSHTNPKNMYGAAGLTLMVLTITGLVLFFVRIYTPDPPFPEEPMGGGVELNLGYSDEGFGDQQPDELLPPAEKTTMDNSAPSQTQTTQQSASVSQDVITGDDPESTPVTTTKAVTTTKPVDNTPKVNDLATYKGSKNKGGVNQGNNPKGIGDMGDPRGTPNGKNYSGNPGIGGGDGPNGSGPKVGGNIKARVKYLDRPVYDNTEEGIVVVKVIIDERGNVMDARGGVGGSTTTSKALIKLSEDAAKKSKFHPSDRVDNGTITYKYIRE